VGSESDRRVEIKNKLELLWKAALLATLCEVETLGFLSSTRGDVLSPHTKFIFRNLS
jgi:hypothetical protein